MAGTEDEKGEDAERGEEQRRKHQPLEEQATSSPLTCVEAVCFSDETIRLQHEKLNLSTELTYGDIYVTLATIV